MSISISENLTRFRKAAGLTQEQLAENFSSHGKPFPNGNAGKANPTSTPLRHLQNCTA